MKAIVGMFSLHGSPMHIIIMIINCNMQYKDFEDESEYESEWAQDSDYDGPMSASLPCYKYERVWSPIIF